MKQHSLGRPTRSGRRADALLLASATAVAGTLLATAPTADALPSTSAARCSTATAVNVSSGSGHGIKSGGTPIRVGPSSSCRAVRVVGSSTLLYYHCWRFNSANNLWTHVRIAGTSTSGWVYNGNLDDGGARSDKESCALPGPH